MAKLKMALPELE
jgi:hypothetical protein